jgi:hypothetical protein
LTLTAIPAALCQTTPKPNNANCRFSTLYFIHPKSLGHKKYISKSAAWNDGEYSKCIDMRK